MPLPSLSLREDMLIRVAGGDRCAMSRSVAAARSRGLTRIALVLAADQPAAAEAGFLAAVAQLSENAGLVVLSGIEAPFRDDHGGVELTRSAAGFDYVYTSDASFPLAGEGYAPGDIRTLLATDRLLPSDAVDSLVSALCNTMVCHDNLVLVEPFVLLEHIGLSQSCIACHHLERLVHVATHTGAVLAVVENGHNPPLASLVAFYDAGVEVVVATGADSPRRVGRYRRCLEIIAAVCTEQHRGSPC